MLPLPNPGQITPCTVMGGTVLCGWDLVAPVSCLIDAGAPILLNILTSDCVFASWFSVKSFDLFLWQPRQLWLYKAKLTYCFCTFRNLSFADHFHICSGERKVDPSIRARWAIPSATGWHRQREADGHTDRCQPLSRGCHVSLRGLLWLHTVHWSVSECASKTLDLSLLGCRKYLLGYSICFFSPPCSFSFAFQHQNWHYMMYKYVQVLYQLQNHGK